VSVESLSFRFKYWYQNTILQVVRDPSFRQSQIMVGWLRERSLSTQSLGNYWQLNQHSKHMGSKTAITQCEDFPK